MFDSLVNGFRAAKNRLAGKVELTEQNVNDALEDIRVSLLEADVEYNVTNTFLNKVKEKAIGEIFQYKVKHDGIKLKVTAEEHFIKICNDELVTLMGAANSTLNYNDFRATSIMLVGLHGTGKTTTAGKLAKYLRDNKKKSPLLVAADIYRPAAVEQLKIVGGKLNIPVFHEENTPPPRLCRDAMEYAGLNGHDLIIFDTAGRLTIDDSLMKELVQIKDLVNPENILLVCDAMIGQDAVRTAKEFNTRLDLTGFILTKLDGDTRGGAALSIREVTGKPIKFLGMGESFERLEEFRPEGLASRILGFGDVVGLIKDFEKVVDEKQAQEDAQRMLKGQFTFEDFLSQLKAVKKMGPLQDIMEKMPGMSEMMPAGATVDDKELIKVEAIIHSMTRQERIEPDIINNSRLDRISKGSGRKINEVRELLNKFFQMRKLMANLSKGSGFLSKIPGFKHLSKMAGLSDMEDSDDEDSAYGQRKTMTPEEKKRLKNKRKQAEKARKKNRRR